jgi:hypothetical protein
MLNSLPLARVGGAPYSLAVDSLDVRREYLRQGGRLRETARALNTTHQNVQQHVERANRIAPLTYGQGETEDRAAVQAFVRYQLKRAGIEMPPSN